VLPPLSRDIIAPLPGGSKDESQYYVASPSVWPVSTEVGIRVRSPTFEVTFHVPPPAPVSTIVAPGPIELKVARRPTINFFRRVGSVENWVLT
jgi:hypothetical protein